jgi:2-polyprenyl-3-methyl-5-hydroxy-6-metoxy-1,4-benzoquinol methylase/uncharacterized protein YbaR (Trm112 family)
MRPAVTADTGALQPRGLEDGMTETGRDFFIKSREIMCCPRCGGDLTAADGRLVCGGCGQAFDFDGDIPMLFSPNEWDPSKGDVTNSIKAFYEENPFPNYDDFDSAASLIEKARRGLFAKLLDDQIPFGTRVLECGCGTGQLTNFLSIGWRTVIGTDICMNSLKMAQSFRNKNHLQRAHFCQMNLFRPCFRPQTFDVVLSNGVLHHTSDPFLAFTSLCSLVKPEGHVLVGLYHRYGRIWTDVRRVLFNLTRDRLKFLDHRSIDRRISAAKRRSWFMDQFKNPHESKHTVGEVLRWLDRTGFTFVHNIPRSVPFARINESERLFEPVSAGSALERFVVDLGELFGGHREGGFFIVIAKKTRTP